MPAGRDETFSIEIGISTAHKGRTGGQVVDRLEELTQVVEGIFYDLDSGAPRLLAVEGVTNLSLVSRVALDVWPGSEGYEGSSVVTFLVRCRI
jgi:hypothetical protein